MKENCLFCGGACNEVYHFGNQPDAASFSSYFINHCYSLVLRHCKTCDLYQANDSRFGFDDSYQFHSSLAKSYQSVLFDFCSFNTLPKNAVITEIGCNDGSLLSSLQKLGFSSLYGFEPVPHLADKAVELSNAKVCAEPFNLSTFGKVPQSDVVICNHTFHQLPNLNETIEALRLLIKPQGRLIIEVPDFEKIVKENAWEQISHDNACYFTQSSMLNLMSKYFAIEQVTELDLPVSSKRYIFVPKVIPDYNFKKEYSPIDLSTFKRQITFSKFSYLETLIQWKKMHRLEIAAFGAGSRGVSFLNYLGIDRDLITYCVDETPGKWGKLMPKSNIPILSLQTYRELTKKPDIMLILPVNLHREIKQKLEHPACYIKTPSGEFKRV